MYSAIPGSTGMVALRECAPEETAKPKTKASTQLVCHYTSGVICSAKAGFLLRPNRTVCERDLKTSHTLGRERRKNQRHHLGRRTANIY